MQLPVGLSHPVVGAATGEADDVLRSNVRRKQRGAHGEPADVTTREEIVRRGLLILGGPPHNAADAHEVDGDLWIDHPRAFDLTILEQAIRVGDNILVMVSIADEIILADIAEEDGV